MPERHCIRWLNIISSVISGKEDAFQSKKEPNYQLIDDIEQKWWRKAKLV